jgi:hypothetical protein
MPMGEGFFHCYLIFHSNQAVPENLKLSRSLQPIYLGSSMPMREGFFHCYLIFHSNQAVPDPVIQLKIDSLAGTLFFVSSFVFSALRAVPLLCLT